MTQPAPTNPKPLFVRVSKVADAWGVPRPMLVDDILAGRLPVRYAQFGRSRIVHVHAGDVAALEATMAPGGTR